ncbi:hypothetical protein BDV18DRAFT_159650 [Aspergillus unguis]
MVANSGVNLPPCRRFITTHNPNGESVYIPFIQQDYRLLPGLGGCSRSYAVSSTPANLAGDADIAAYTHNEGTVSHTRSEIVLPGTGAHLAVVDIQPGGQSWMHRTVSIDFSICVIGTIDHELDSGQVVRLGPGDHVVQRGTMHRCINASKTEPARFVAVILPSEEFSVGGKPLREEHLPEEEPKAKI